MRSVHELLRHYDLEPRKRFSQNFLVDRGALKRIVTAAELSPGESVLEIGAGLGTLTHALVEEGAQVVAVEIDRELVPILRQELADYANVRIIEGDILALDPAELMEDHPYKVVANLPYAITSAVLRHLLEARVPPQRAIVMVQREVAERIVARDGRLSVLAISIHLYGEPRLLFRLKRGAFYPAPSVESAVLRIDLHPQPPVHVADTARFFRVVRAGFSQPRKQVHNSLSGGLALDRKAIVEALLEVGIDPRRRAERLRLEDWARLTEVLDPYLNNPNK
jgi:16S rRNA (adenine1518-N6/adenine1519-N6)-dimethyltransferase